MLGGTISGCAKACGEEKGDDDAFLFLLLPSRLPSSAPCVVGVVVVVGAAEARGAGMGDDLGGDGDKAALLPHAGAAGKGCAGEAEVGMWEERGAMLT